MRRLLAVLGVGLALAVGSVAPAHAATDYALKITNVGQKSMTICKDWVSSYPTTTSACANGLGVLYPGENSRTKFGWSDADGVRVPAGYSLREQVVGTDPVVYGCRSYTFYGHVEASLFDSTRSLYLWDCPAY